MKLLKVEYLEESSTAVFFNVTIEMALSWSAKTKKITRKAYFEKPPNELGLRYVSTFYWADTNSFNGSSQMHIIQEMILQYQKSNPIDFKKEIVDAYNFGESASSGNAEKYYNDMYGKV